MPISPLITCTKPFFLQQSQALLCAPGSPRGKMLAEHCALVPPSSGALGHESWTGVLQGHLLGTEAGWLVTKAECGGTRGGCLLDGSSLRMFHCLPGSALPPAHPRFTGPSCRCLSGGKHSPLGSRPLLCGPLLVWGEGPARHQ